MLMSWLLEKGNLLADNRKIFNLKNNTTFISCLISFIVIWTSNDIKGLTELPLGKFFYKK